MMEEMYGLHSSADYSDHHHQHHQNHQPVPMMPQPETTTIMPSPADYQAAFASFRDRLPIMFGSEQFFSSSSAVSDAASVTVSEIHHRGGGGCGGSENNEVSSTIRAKIASHPLYPKLLEAYIDCQKVGAPPEIVYVLDEIRRESDISRRAAVTSCLGVDPELDEFMETYCDILLKYKSDLARPFDEATMFLHNIETQLNNLCNASSRTSLLSEEAAGSSSEDLSGGESLDMQQDSQRTSEERELKDNLLRKYSGYISTLKHEFSKKKKKGKLPKEARQSLLDWWNVHYKWPYPTEVDKIALAESTGLDQKQINNWFINQRKRHWKPSENMQFAVMDSIYGPFFTND